MRNQLQTTLGNGLGIQGAGGSQQGADDLGRYLLGGGSMSLTALQAGRQLDLRVNWVLLSSAVLGARKDSENQAIADLAR